MEVHFDGHCFGCGPLNDDGLRLKFEPGPDGSVAEYHVPERFQSWSGMAHGGIVALMLDEAVGWAAWHAGHPGVTGRLQVSYRRPLKLGEHVRIVGKLEKVRRNLVYVAAVVENAHDRSRIADATATLMEVKTVVDPIER
ncbi:MAG TPA: PaaI family thioesterase [Candidatus Dormibacteraeota bacterium]|nr:PaaI family thioesterase [Candidatus Dormibacteraeota bacterium]